MMVTAPDDAMVEPPVMWTPWFELPASKPEKPRPRMVMAPVPLLRLELLVMKMPASPVASLVAKPTDGSDVPPNSRKPPEVLMIAPERLIEQLLPPPKPPRPLSALELSVTLRYPPLGREITALLT